MPQELTGNDFGDLSRLKLAREGARQRGQEFSFSHLSSALQNAASRGQQADQFDRTMGLNIRRDADRKREFDESLKLNRELYSQKAEVKAADLAQGNALKELKFRVDNRLPIPPDLVKKAGEQGTPLIQADVEMRREELKLFKTAQEAALAKNRLDQIELRAGQLEKSEGESTFEGAEGGSVLGWLAGKLAGPSNRGREQAKELRERAAPLRVRYESLFDEKAGLIRIDPTTGKAVSAIDPFPWMRAHAQETVPQGNPSREVMMNRSLPVSFRPGPQSPAPVPVRVAPQTNAAPNINIVVPQTAPSTGSTIPPAAISYLQAHPEMRDAFDQKYGSGASSQFLQ